MQMHLSIPKAGRHPGFTLLELLVVIAVIGVLVGILLPVLGKVRRSAKESTTRAFIKNIETACAAYEFDFGFYPCDAPTKGIATGKSAGGAALYQQLATPFRIMVPPPPNKGEYGASKDAGPYLDVPEKHRKGTAPNVYIVDIWSNPICYDNIRDPMDATSGQTAANGFNDATSFITTCGVASGSDIRNGTTFVTNSGVGQNLQGIDVFSLGQLGAGTVDKPLANFKCKTD